MSTHINTTAPVEVVLTDEAEIFERRTFPAAEVDAKLEQLNDGLVGSLHWRQARTHLAPLNSLCGSCGTRRCWCGVSRLVHRSEEPRR